MAKPAFDPNLPFESAAAGKPAFDPNLPFEAAAGASAAPERDPGRLMALGRGGLQGATLGFGDELAGGITGLLQAGTNALPQALRSRLDLVEAPAGEAYSYSRDLERQHNKAAEDAHGGTYLAGNILGGLATGRMIPGIQAAKGAGLGERALVGFANGVPVGAAYGAGLSEAKDAGRFATDSAAGAVGGGVLGAGGTLAGAGLKAALAGLPRGLQALGIRAGRKVLTNGADQLSRRGPIREEAVKEALEGGAIRFAGTSRGTLGRLENLSEAQLEQYRNVLSELEARGVRGPDAERVADTLMAEAASIEPNTMNNAIPRLYRVEAEKLFQKAGPNGETSVTQMEALKRSLQDPKLYNRVEDAPLMPARRDIAGIFRKANEAAIAEQAAARPGDAPLQALNENFVPVKRRLGNLLEAQSAAERGAAREAQRGHFSLYDAMAALAGAGHGGAAHGWPGLAMGAATGLASKVLRQRLPSSLASSAYGLGRSMESGVLSEAGALLNPRVAQAALGEELLGRRLSLSPNPSLLTGGDADPEMFAQLASANALRRRKDAP